MANNWDARIKLLYPVDVGTFFTADTVVRDKAFDVIANVEVGKGIHQFTDAYTISVSVVNLSKSTLLAQKSDTDKLPPDETEYNAELRVNFPSGWAAKADVGDVLQAVASYTVSAGSQTDYSTDTSEMFLVVAK